MPRDGRVDLYAAWDSSRSAAAPKPLASADPAAPAAPAPVFSPLRISLRRRGEVLEGTAAFRIAQGGRTCTVSAPARLSGCAGDRAVLSAPVEVRADVDLDACAPLSAPAMADVPLRRR